MITALDQVADRVRGLEAGADDFLTKPVNDLQLMTRVKSLVRLKMLTDELRLRASTTRNIGIEELLQRQQPVGAGQAEGPADRRARAILRARFARCSARPPTSTLRRTRMPASSRLPKSPMNASSFRPASRNSTRCGYARSCARSTARASLPIILLADAAEDQRILRGLELGINDYLIASDRRAGADRAAGHPGQAQALQRPSARQRDRDDRDGGDRRSDRPAQSTLSGQPSADPVRPRRGAPAAAVSDDHRSRPVQVDQRYVRPWTAATTCCANSRDGCGGMCAASIWPAVLAARSSSSSCPTPNRQIAEKVAERVRAEIARTPFAIGKDGQTVEVTVSVGVSSLLRGKDTVEALMKRADAALYEAKSGGRNRVVAKAA